MSYDDKCTVTCTDNGKVAEAEVDRIEPKDYLKIFMIKLKINKS